MRLKAHSALALAALALVGCGGGSSDGGNATAKTARVGVFVTDDLGAYDHVWVTVRSIVLVGPSGDASVYDDPTGKLVDLASLHGAAGSIFQLLGLGTAPAGTYKRALVTLDDDLTLFPEGATVGQTRKFKGAAGGQRLINVEVEGEGEDIRGDDSLVIDFDLSRWTDDGTTVTAVAGVRGHEGLDDPARHRGEDAKGTVSGLTATGFTLTGRGLPITVAIDANTAVFGGATALANGQRVEVRGAFSTATRTLVATSVKVEDGTEAENEAEIRGGVAALGTDAFDLTVGSTDGFLPASASVHVVLGTNVRFRGAHGATVTQAEFFAALTVGEAVEAEGAYDAATNTLTATKLKVEAENEGGHGGNDPGHGGSGGHGGDDGPGHG